MKVKLSDIQQAIDFQMDEDLTYLEKSTGEVFIVPEDVLSGVEEDDVSSIGSYYDDEILEVAKKILQKPDDFIDLPSQYDMHEYSIMEKFCFSIEDEQIQKRAFDAIRGQGTFRRFKDLMHRVDLIEKWYKYRDDAIKREIIVWCEVHEIAYED